MFQQMLYAQWKWNRDLLAFFTVAGFAIPVLVVSFAMPAFGDASTREFLMAGRMIGGLCLCLAALAGAAVAAQGYGADERGGHIYALALPVTRRRFLVLRTLGALALLVLPAAAIWVGGALAAGQLELPPALRAYAGALATRALLAAWLVHACVFALRYSAGPRLRGVLVALILVLIGVAVVMNVMPEWRDPIGRFGLALVSHPGPFGVLFGRWTLIDV